MTTELSSEAAMTRKLLARIPEQKLTWQPASDLHSIGRNATHLAEIIGWVPGILGHSKFDMAPVGGEAYVVPDSVMDDPWSLKMGGQILFTLTKGNCLRKWVFSHSAHHRGILSALLASGGSSVSVDL